jgi:hypothetical protein
MYRGKMNKKKMAKEKKRKKKKNPQLLRYLIAIPAGNLKRLLLFVCLFVYGTTQISLDLASGENETTITQ